MRGPGVPVPPYTCRVTGFFSHVPVAIMLLKFYLRSYQHKYFESRCRVTAAFLYSPTEVLWVKAKWFI